MALASDVKKGFFAKQLGYAYFPKPAKASEPETDLNAYGKLTPEEEGEVSPELRQAAFENLKTTDDHLMHVIGLAEDQAGNSFFYTKNSWSETGSPYRGYLYISEKFAYMKTISILINRKAIPAEIADKLGMK